MKSLEEIKASGKVWDVMPMAIKMPIPTSLSQDMMCGNIHLKDCGTCSVEWSAHENGYEHVSISPMKKFRIPTWDDMCELKDVFWHDEEEAYQIMPKKSEYVNIQKNCLHLWKPVGHILGELAVMADREATPLEKLTNTEAYLNHLNRFDPKKDTCIIVVDTEKRIKYNVSNTVMIDDSE